MEYGDKAPGYDNHHGVLDKWLSVNVKGYKSRESKSISMRLTKGDHAITKSVYQKWKIKNYGFKGKVDWTNISPREIFALSEQMFDAINVPQDARNEFYINLTNDLYKRLP